MIIYILIEKDAFRKIIFEETDRIVMCKVYFTEAKTI